jgi:hypothetical protein
VISFDPLALGAPPFIIASSLKFFKKIKWSTNKISLYSTVVGSTSQHFRVPPLEIILAVDVEFRLFTVSATVK